MDADLNSEHILYTISDWYDGPRGGATEFEGRAYFYRSVYLDSDVWDPNENRFKLTPLTDDALSWELEITHIFERWDSARKDGDIVWHQDDEAAFGALPEDMQRYRDLNEKLKAYLSMTKPKLLVYGSFDGGPKTVRWKPIEKLKS